MFIASRKKLTTIPEEPNVGISRNKIERVKTYKCLGLEPDEGLIWESHISAIISKVSKVIRFLRRLCSYLSREFVPTSTLHEHNMHGPFSYRGCNPRE
jgi:hypothetical protein